MFVFILAHSGIAVALRKPVDQGRHQHFAHRGRTRKLQLGDERVQIGAARPFALNAGAIDRQLAILGFDAVELAIKAQQGAA